MPDRKMWNAGQDRVLRLLREDRGEKKWSVIARIMETEFAIKGRTGKQCRERYHNHLDSSIKSAEWTQDEEAVLYRLHDQLGNKWSLIAQRLAGRTDNCVKNHFYSKLRKAVRKLNKAISQKYKKTCSEIKLTSLYKILQISQNKYKMNSKYDEEIIEKCLALKNTLYRLEPLLDKERTNTEDLFLCELINDLNSFEQKMKKPGKSSKKCKDSQLSLSSKTEGEELVKKQEASDQPFYQTFKRICEEMIRSNA